MKKNKNHQIFGCITHKQNVMKQQLMRTMLISNKTLKSLYFATVKYP